MKLARITIFVICLFLFSLINSSHNVAVADTCLPLTPVELSSLPDELGYYFLTRDISPNNPNRDVIQLNYVDMSGVHRLDLTFSPSELVALNPTGEYFVVIDGVGDASYQNPGSFSYFREPINNARVIQIGDFTETQLDFLADANLTDIMLHVHWVGDDRFDLLETTDTEVATHRVNLADSTLSTQIWNLPDLELTYSEGRIFISPNGDYLFYTSSISREYPLPDITQSWVIVDENGVILQEDKALYSRTVAWLPDNSGLIFTTVNHIPSHIDFDGELTFIPYEELPQRTISQSVITSDARLSAHVINRRGDADALMFIDWVDGTVRESCQDYYGIDIRSFSPDDRFLPISVADGEAIALHFVDVVTDELIIGASYPATTRVTPLGWGIRPPLD